MANCWCKSCKAKYERERRKKGYDKKDMTTPAARFYNGKSRAKRKGIVWSITKEEFIQLLAKPCEYCGDPLPVNTGYCLDRVIPKQGYIIENVVSCCFRCNQVKSHHLTYQEMKAVMNLVKEMRMSKFTGVYGCEPLAV